MNVEDFTYNLPERLIASHPAARRTESRLLFLPKDQAGAIEHGVFTDLRNHLRAGDVLVLNNSRVIPARLYGRRESGGRVEMLLLEPTEGASIADAQAWNALVRPAKKLREGDLILIGDEPCRLRVRSVGDSGERVLENAETTIKFREIIAKHGQLPLPPYILKRRADEEAGLEREKLYGAEDNDRYQTVFSKPEGSVAAPTAGLHFSEDFLGELHKMGVKTVFLTLHVGAGTFQTMPEGGKVEDHRMHFEEYEVSPEAADEINRAKSENRRVIAVGTTSVRTMESAASEEGGIQPGRGRTNLMIKPGYRFQVVDGLLTNFHLPRSTLLLLVSALAGRERILEAYRQAIEREYRFFSYGDAMLIL